MRLSTGWGGRAPQVHIRVRDVGSPGEIDQVYVVESQTGIFFAWIDEVHKAVAG